MTDIAVPESTPDLPALNPGGIVQPATPATPAPAVPALLAWAREAREAHQIAQSLAGTSFVPATMRGKPSDVTGAILAGHELGLSPMAALRSIDLIQGTPGLRAHAMRGLVQSHGHEVEVVEASEQTVVMRGRRRGAESWQTVTWTIARAAKLGLTGKDQWKKQPQTMLIARATGEVCRLIAADVLHAMPYASEELDGYGQQAALASVPREETAAPAVPTSVTLAELTAPAPAPAVTPSSDGVAFDRDVEDAPDVDGYDDADWPEVIAPGTAGAR